MYYMINMYYMVNMYYSVKGKAGVEMENQFISLRLRL